MKNPYGNFTEEDGHEQTALGLPGMNQYDKNVAMLANEVRLTLRLDACVEHKCTSTDMVIAAALSIDEKISVNTLNQAFINKKYKLDNPTSTTGVDWGKFIDEQMGLDNYDANIRLIHRFTQEVQDLYFGQRGYVPSDVDWNYLMNTLK